MIVAYGLTEKELLLAEQKIKKQNDFLENSFFVDEANGLMKPLKDFVKSKNINPKRYYAQIQNIVNTMQKFAQFRGLEPIFMTITLPSRYHKNKLKNGKLIPNPKYDGFTTPKEANKLLTDMFTSLRNDRSMRIDNILSDDRMYFRTNEPQESGTPHTHILLFVPNDSIPRIVSAFKRLYNNRGNKIDINLINPVGYIMKYVLKILINSKKENISKQDRYLNGWYSYNKIRLFSFSRSLAPLYVYNKISQHLTLYEATYSLKESKHLLIYKEFTKLLEIDLILGIDEFSSLPDMKNLYTKNNNFSIMKINKELQSA